MDMVLYRCKANFTLPIIINYIVSGVYESKDMII